MVEKKQNTLKAAIRSFNKKLLFYSVETHLLRKQAACTCMKSDIIDTCRAEVIVEAGGAGGGFKRRRAPETVSGLQGLSSYTGYVFSMFSVLKRLSFKSFITVRFAFL